MFVCCSSCCSGVDIGEYEWGASTQKMTNLIFELIDREIKSYEYLCEKWANTQVGEHFKSKLQYYKGCKVIISSSLDLDDLEYEEPPQ